ncbi:putative Endonuclease/exonuclease/phosphatase superfamily [Helianthus annuus]|nr:putative Endonuclease/exonuclease/phosphatase superfamily [Helianthus annuus]
MRNSQGMWCCMGDFNVVRFQEERKNSVFKARDFNDFIDEAGLREYCMKGLRYTFLAGKGLGFKMSKIDCFLVCSDFFDRWPEACLRALPRYLSDHSPLLLTLDNKNYGSRPFRWFNSWINREGCSELLSISLGNFMMTDPSDLVLSKKLKFLRSLRDWKAKLDNTEKEEMICLKDDLAVLEKNGEERDQEEEEEWAWSECKNRISELEASYSSDL